MDDVAVKERKEERIGGNLFQEVPLLPSLLSRAIAIRYFANGLGNATLIAFIFARTLSGRTSASSLAFSFFAFFAYHPIHSRHM